MIDLGSKHDLARFEIQFEYAHAKHYVVTHLEKKMEKSEEEELLVQENATQAAVLTAEARLAASAGRDYDAHVTVIALLRGLGELERTRAARERFAAAFPLTEAQWVEWIDDEHRAEGGTAAAALVERSLEDYMSVVLWQRHLVALAPQIETGGDVDAVRARFEAAVAIAGHHFLDGAKLWRCIVAFEDAVLAMSLGDAKSAAAARARVRSVYRRAIATPLLVGSAERFLSAYAAWEEAQPPDADEEAPDAEERVEALAPLAARTDARCALFEQHELVVACAVQERDAARAAGDAVALAAAEASLAAAWCAYSVAASRDEERDAASAAAPAIGPATRPGASAPGKRSQEERR